MDNPKRRINWKYISRIGLSLLVIATLILSGLQFTLERQNNIPKVVIKVGNIEAYTGTPDYVGTTDVEVQQALDALPATGGEIVLISPVYTFSATVSRAINNVAITGLNGTTVNYDGASAVFSVGVQTGWVFRNIKTDAGSITNYTSALLDNVTLGADYFTLRAPNTTGNIAAPAITDSGLTAGRAVYAGTGGLLSSEAGYEYNAGTNTLSVPTLSSTTLNAPTGRGATYVIAASDATDLEKAQADVICDGTDDQIEINAGIDSGAGNGLAVLLSSGNFNISAPIKTWSVISSSYSLLLKGTGIYITRINTTENSDFNAIEHITDNSYPIIREVSDLSIGLTTPTAGSGFYIYCSASGKTVGDYHIMRCGISYAHDYGIYLGGLDTPAWGPKIENCWIEYCDSYGVWFHAQQGYITNCFISYNGGIGLDLPVGSGPNHIMGTEIGRSGNECVTCYGEDNKFVGCTISSWGYNDITAYGIYLGGNYHIINGCTLSGVISYPSWSGVGINNNSKGHRITNNIIHSCTTYGVIFASGSDTTDTIVSDNYIDPIITTPISNLNNGLGNTISNNTNYISPSEIRTASGSLTAGNANAIAFAWHDPELQDVYIQKVIVTVTTAGGTAGSHLDVGIADDAAGTNRGTEFFDDLLLENISINDSTVAASAGTQTVWVLCQDNASATDGWIVGQILDANAASLVGSYYIEYVGK